MQGLNSACTWNRATEVEQLRSELRVAGLIFNVTVALTQTSFSATSCVNTGRVSVDTMVASGWQPHKLEKKGLHPDPDSATEDLKQDCSSDLLFTARLKLVLNALLEHSLTCLTQYLVCMPLLFTLLSAPCAAPFPVHAALLLGHSPLSGDALGALMG